MYDVTRIIANAVSGQETCVRQQTPVELGRQGLEMKQNKFAVKDFVQIHKCYIKKVIM